MALQQHNSGAGVPALTAGVLPAAAECLLGVLDLVEDAVLALGGDGVGGAEAHEVAADGVDDGVHVAERRLACHLLALAVLGHPLVPGLPQLCHRRRLAGVRLLQRQRRAHLLDHVARLALVILVRVRQGTAHGAERRHQHCRHRHLPPRQRALGFLRRRGARHRRRCVAGRGRGRDAAMRGGIGEQGGGRAERARRLEDGG